MSHPTYFEAFDARQLLQDYPIGDAFVRRYTAISRDELRALQEERFARVMRRGWEIPFYRRLWGGKGIEPGDIRGLDDLPKLSTPTGQQNKFCLGATCKDHFPKPQY